MSIENSNKNGEGEKPKKGFWKKATAIIALSAFIFTSGYLTGNKKEEDTKNKPSIKTEEEVKGVIKEVVEKDTKETIKEVNFKEKFGFYSPSRGEGFFQMVENLRNEGFIISNKLVYDTYEEMKKQGKTGLSSSLQLFDIEKKDCKKYITSFTLNLVKLEKPVVTLTTVPTVPKVDQESEKEEVNMCWLPTDEGQPQPVTTPEVDKEVPKASGGHGVPTDKEQENQKKQPITEPEVDEEVPAVDDGNQGQPVTTPEVDKEVPEAGGGHEDSVDKELPEAGGGNGDSADEEQEADGENGGSTDEGQPVTIPEVSGGDGGSTTDLTTTTAYQEAHIINCIETINNIENNCNQSEASVAGGN